VGIQTSTEGQENRESSPSAVTDLAVLVITTQLSQSFAAMPSFDLSHPDEVDNGGQNQKATVTRTMINATNQPGTGALDEGVTSGRPSRQQARDYLPIRSPV
jgi:hypothetical protein